MDLALRPGFNLDTAFKGHLAIVRRVLYNPAWERFISADDKSLKSWSTYGLGNIKVHADYQFPAYQTCFVTCMAICPDLDILFAGCLDGFLRLYNHRLDITSVMPWSNGVVREIVYNPKTQELITAGSYGVKIWECELDLEAYKADEDVDPYDLPRMKDGKYVPWCFGKHQHAKTRVQINVPGARQVGGRPEVISGGSSWSDKISLHVKSQTLWVVFQASVFGYEAGSGAMTYSFPNLHNSPITSFLYLPDNNTLITTVADAAATVWRIAGVTLHRFKQLGKTSSPTLHIAADEHLNFIVTTAADGGVTFWSAATLEPTYRMKLSKVPPAPPVFYGTNRFALHVDNSVRLFSVQHLYDNWMECYSMPVSLQQIGYGLILASFADSSVRILDGCSKNPDKSVMTTTPQLSAFNLVAVSCSLDSGMLFTLLSNGHVHVWELHLTKPSCFKEAWTHISKERCTSLTFLSGASVSAGVAAAMSLSTDRRSGVVHDHVFMGTATGDCLVCDVGRNGAVIFRFPAFKHQPLQSIAIHAERGALLTSSKCCLKIWNMADMKLLHNLLTTLPVSKIDILQEQAIVGTASGSIHLVHIGTGNTRPSNTASDHMDGVTGIGPSEYLQHFVTSSKDSHIKVFDCSKTFKRSIYVGAPLSCCCYLNDTGDIIAGLGNRIIVVKSSKYEFVPRDDESNAVESIYDNMRGKGTVKAAIKAIGLLAMVKNADRARLPSSRGATPPSAVPAGVQQSPSLPTTTPPTDSHPEGGDKRQIKRSNTLVAAIQAAKTGGVPLPQSRSTKSKEEEAKPPPGMLTVPPAAWKGKPPAVGGYLSGIGTATLPGTPSSLTESPRQSSPTHSGPGSTSHSGRGSSPLRRGSSPLGRGTSPPVRGTSPLGRRGLVTHKHSSSAPTGRGAASSACALASNSRVRGTSPGGRPAASVNVASGTSGDEATGTEDESSAAYEDDEGEERDDGGGGGGDGSARRMQRTLSELQLDMAQRDALKALAEYQQGLLPCTTFNIDLTNEAERRRRRINGLTTPSGVEDPKPLSKVCGMFPDGTAGPAHMFIGVDGVPMLNIGSLQVHALDDDDDDADGEEGGRGGSRGADAANNLLSDAVRGLAPAFRRALPIICSDTAFLEDMPPELAAQLRDLTKIMTKKKKKKKKIVTDAVALGFPGLLGEPEGTKKKRKKKRRKKKKGGTEDPFLSLSKGTNEDYIKIQLKGYELHDMRTKPSQHFLPRLRVPKPGISSSVGGEKEEVAEKNAAGSHLDPPDATKLLRNFRDGWQAKGPSEEEQFKRLSHMMSAKVQASKEEVEAEFAHRAADKRLPSVANVEPKRMHSPGTLAHPGNVWRQSQNRQIRPSDQSGVIKSALSSLGAGGLESSLHDSHGHKTTTFS